MGPLSYSLGGPAFSQDSGPQGKRVVWVGEPTGWDRAAMRTLGSQGGQDCLRFWAHCGASLYGPSLCSVLGDDGLDIRPKITTLLRARQKGDSKWEKPVSEKNLRFSVVSCENLQFSAQICDSQIPWFTEWAENQRKSAKICENVRSGSGFSLLLSPFWRALNYITLFSRINYVWCNVIVYIDNGLRMNL